MWNKSNEEVIQRIEILNNKDFIYASARSTVHTNNWEVMYERGNFYMVYLCRSYHGQTDTETIVYHIMGNEVDDFEEKFNPILFKETFSTTVYEREYKFKQLGI